MSHLYSNINSQLHVNQNLSLYARQQKEQRIEHSKLTPNQQKERLLEIYNNRPPVLDTDQTNAKQITTTTQQNRVKCPMGIINPAHQFEDPRVKKNEKIQKEQEWYAERQHTVQPPKPEDPLLQPQPDLTLQAAKIHLKPPPILEKEKPLMLDHLVNPYIYITKIFKKNSEDSHIKHPDIWDKSTHKTSVRKNKQAKKGNKERPESAQQGDALKDKEERKQFYLKNLKMKEFLFKYFKQVNQLLKARKYNKIIYDGERVEYDLKTLFQLWGEHKKLNFKNNGEMYIGKELFVDFMMMIGMDPDRKGDAERFFDYCHDDVAKSIESGQQLQQKQKDSQWFTMFKQ